MFAVWTHAKRPGVISRENAALSLQPTPEETHAPAVQACPDGHTTPQPPQLAASVRSERSHPLAGLASQSPKPALQVNPQEPARHVAAEALAGVGHALPHRPQWEVLVANAASQPLAAEPSQSPKPELQANPQVPEAQVAPALLGAEQARPHDPQLAGLVASVTSQPLPLERSQSARPAEQTKAQVLARHTAEAPARLGHVTPQPPQLLGSTAVLMQRAPQVD
jgi:hypothetical protein